MKPLRVAVISEFPYHGVIVGGVHSAVDVLVRAISQLPEIEKVLVVSFLPRLDRDEIVALNEKLIVHYAAGQRRLALPTDSYLDFVKAKRILKAFEPDVVHGQGTFGHGGVAVRLGYPSVVTIHGVGNFDMQMHNRGNRFIGPLRMYLTQRMTDGILQRADVVISISKFDREFCSRVRQGDVVHIPNAVRPEFFTAEPEFPESARINFSGVIIERKNVAGLVRAFKKVKERVPEAVLDIAGPATDREYYERVQRSIDPTLKDSIVFHGNLKGCELTQLVQRASVCVLFSIYENLPVVIAEALALGKPVVASRVGGVEEMIDEGETGFVVAPQDENALADRLVRLLNDKQLRRAMGMKGREHALKNWKPERVAAETVGAYRMAIRSRRGLSEQRISDTLVEAVHD
jgi:glycosyltransferase involved in cell wall biosynthesis